MADREALYIDTTAGETEPQTVSVYDQTTTPANEAAKAKLYAKDVGGTAKMHALDSAGAEIELGSGGSAFDIDSTVQTTDATVTLIHTVATTTDNVTWIEATIQGRDNTANEAAFFKFSALFDNNSGTVSQKGSTTVLDSHEDDVSWDFDLNISGTDVQIRVTGDATNAVEWRVLGNTGTHG